MRSIVAILGLLFICATPLYESLRHHKEQAVAKKPGIASSQRLDLRQHIQTYPGCAAVDVINALSS